MSDAAAMLKLTCGKTCLEFSDYKKSGFFDQYHWEKWCEAVKRCAVAVSDAEQRRINAELPEGEQ